VFQLSGIGARYASRPQLLKLLFEAGNFLLQSDYFDVDRIGLDFFGFREFDALDPFSVAHDNLGFVTSEFDVLDRLLAVGRRKGRAYLERYSQNSDRDEGAPPAQFRPVFGQVESASDLNVIV
jgi:hypothetical protein